MQKGELTPRNINVGEKHLLQKDFITLFPAIYEDINMHTHKTPAISENWHPKYDILKMLKY